MRRAMLRLGAALALSLGIAGAALAGSLVEFPNVSEREPKLLDYLARPDGNEPATKDAIFLLLRAQRSNLDRVSSSAGIGVCSSCAPIGGPIDGIA